MSTDKNILEVCKSLLDQYNDSISPAHFLKDVNESQDLDEPEKQFICEIFFGCCDKTKVLSVVVDGYYVKDGKNSLKSEKNYYKILAYIGIYRIKKFGLDELKSIVHYWNQEKMLKFLVYLFNEKNLLTWIKDAWSSKYDHEYVSKELIDPIINLLPEVDVFLKDLEYKIYNPKRFKHIPPTEPEPFHFRQTLVRKILLPEKLDVPKPRIRYDLAKFKSAPEPEDFVVSETFENSKTSLKEKKKSSKPPIRRELPPQQLQPIEKPPKFKAKEFKVPANSAPVKINTAVVLREEAVLKKQTQEVIKNFEYLENGDRNANEFKRWQQEMKKTDLKQQIENSEKLKLQSKISYEKAKNAREEIAKTNKVKAIELQQKAEEHIKKCMEEKREEEIKRKQMVQEIKENEKNVKYIIEELVDAKKQIAKEIIKESEYLQKLALEEAEEEMRNKIELIQQIKAAESITVDRTKMVDLTSKAGHALLSEMSIAELRERLEIARQNNERYKKQMHDNIIKNKVERGQALVEKLHFINKFRNENSQLEKKNKEMSYDDLQKLAREEMLQKNAEIASLKKKLDETRADGSKINRSYKIEHNKTSQQDIYSNQRKIIEMERMKNMEKIKDSLIAVN